MRRFTLALCSISLLAAPLRADEVNLALEPMSVTVQVETAKTVEPIYRAYVAVGEEKFAFLIPEKFRTGGNPAKGKLLLANLTGDSLISLSFISAVSADSAVPGREHYRELLAERYPNGKIVSEFNRPILGRDGLGFDLEWKSPTGFVQKTRAVYVPTVAGMLEVTMTTGLKNFTAVQAGLNQMLGSLVSNANGKMVVHHIASVS